MMDYSYQGRQPLAQLIAMVVARSSRTSLSTTTPDDPFAVLGASSSIANNVWLTDTGCNTHLTLDLAALAYPHKCPPGENVAWVMVNTFQLPIQVMLSHKFTLCLPNL